MKKIKSLSKALKEKEDENEKRIVELKAKAKVERKSNMLRRFGGNARFLVEHGVVFNIVDSMTNKEVEAKSKALSKKVHDEEKVIAKNKTEN